MGAIVARNESHGLSLKLDLERDDLLPGTTARGTLTILASRGLAARRVEASLIATERWKFEQTSMDAGGHPRTQVVTKTKELQRLPVELAGPTQFAAGERRELSLEVSVPGLGPATLEAEVAGLTWELEVKIDVPNGFDAGLVVPVRVLQPTALLRAGVVRVGEFALYEAADSSVGDARASVEIKPMPICVGAPIYGSLTIETNEVMDLQEVRLELRSTVKATVSGGQHEEITMWAGRLVGPGAFGGASQVIPFRGDIVSLFLPTIELPHGRADAAFHVILARSMARDPHLVRDVTICSTTEI